MADKRLFEVLDEMNQHDANNNTRVLAISPHFISADKVKQGGKVAMGVDELALMDLLNDKVMPMLLLIDREEYKKRSEAKTGIKYCIEIEREVEEKMVERHTFETEPTREDVLKFIQTLDCGYDDNYGRFEYYKV